MSIPLYASCLIVVVGCWQWLVGNGMSMWNVVGVAHLPHSDVDKKKRKHERTFVCPPSCLVVAGSGWQQHVDVECGRCVSDVNKKKRKHERTFVRPPSCCCCGWQWLAMAHQRGMW